KTLTLDNYADATAATQFRDLALDKNGNLFFATNQARIAYLIDVVTNPAGLADNSAEKWYTSESLAFSPSFSGLDIGLAAAGVAGDYNDNGIVDTADYTV